MKLPIYLDYSATTPVDPRVAEAMIPYLFQRFGNPASRSHSFGWESEAAVEAARDEVARLVEKDPRFDQPRLSTDTTQPQLSVEIDREHPKSGAGCCSRQYSRYRGLAHATLTGHDDQSGGAEELPWIEALRRNLGAY